MTKAKHTELPWYNSGGIVWFIDVQPNRHTGDAEQVQSIICETSEENAEFIVRACNSHYELLEQLKAARHSLVTYQGLYATDLHPQDRQAHVDNGTQFEFQLDDAELLSSIEAAINKAEGK